MIIAIKTIPQLNLVSLQIEHLGSVIRFLENL